MPKFDLSYIRPKNTIWVVLERVHIPQSNPLPVQLQLQSSGRINAEYTAAMLKLQRDREQEGGAITAAGLDTSDARQLRIFAKHVVVGWAEVRDEAGKDMPFSAKDAEELLLTIAIEQKSPDILASAINRAADQNNFRDSPVGSAETLGKR